MKLKDPTLSDLNGMTDTDYNNTIKLIANCVDMVYDKEDVYPDFTIEEATEFLLSMTQEQFKNIEKFFDTLPKLQHEIKWTCPECGKKDSVTVEGLQSFFT
jgi:ABC-type branched-subunit amino acid transport system ATPase component